MLLAAVDIGVAGGARAYIARHCHLDRPHQDCVPESGKRLTKRDLSERAEQFSSLLLSRRHENRTMEAICGCGDTVTGQRATNYAGGESPVGCADM